MLSRLSAAAPAQASAGALAVTAAAAATAAAVISVRAAGWTNGQQQGSLPPSVPAPTGGVVPSSGTDLGPAAASASSASSSSSSSGAKAEVEEGEEKGVTFEHRMLEGGPAGVPVFVCRWRPAAASSPIRARVLLVHGVGEHCQRRGYTTLAQALCAAGCEVAALDHPGHGRSHGDRGFISPTSGAFGRTVVGSALAVLDAFAAGTLFGDAADEASSSTAPPPLFVFGHSMGGLITQMLALQRSDVVRGVMLSAPASTSDAEVAGVRRQLPVLRFLARWLPRLPAHSLDIEEGLASDPAVLANARADPLYHEAPLGASLLLGLAESIMAVRAATPNFTLPFVLFHGDKDTLVPLAGSQSFTERAGTSADQKAIHIYPGMAHELLHEPDVEEDVRTKCINFIKEHTTTA